MSPTAHGTGLVLASKSPRRRVLFRHLVNEVTIDPADINEVAPRALPIPDALRVIARKKALAVSARHPARWVLAADTVVVHSGELVGKARSEADARLRLASLSGETHQVWTGIALAYNERPVDADAAVTALHMERIPPDVVDAYIKSGAWEGKAGAYGIQDPLLAPYLRIQSGPWSNVVGLPLARTAGLLSRNGVACRAAPLEDEVQRAWVRG